MSNNTFGKKNYGSNISVLRYPNPESKQKAIEAAKKGNISLNQHILNAIRKENKTILDKE